jgi:hypothetical protein
MTFKEKPAFENILVLSQKGLSSFASNRPISVCRLGKMPIQSCGQSVCAPRRKVGARVNALTELRAKRQRSEREAVYRNRPISSCAPTSWSGRSAGTSTRTRSSASGTCTWRSPPRGCSACTDRWLGGQWGRDRWRGGQWGSDRWRGGQWGRDRWRDLHLALAAAGLLRLH